MQSFVAANAMKKWLKTPIYSSFPAHVSTLDNGLTVIHQHLPATPVVVADVWVRAGASVEPPDWSGMAHFLEHMIFKGTDRLAPGMFDQVIESRGGASNAATSHDYAHYFVTAATAHFPDLLPELAELLLQAAIPETEFWRERSVVYEEIRQSYDDPDWLGFQTLIESVYPQHPYGLPILGTEASLQERLPQDMRCFHQSYYQPENMSVVVVGDVELEPTLNLVASCFDAFAPRRQCPPAPPAYSAPVRGIQRQILQLERLEQARLMLAWQGPGVNDLESAYGLDLLSIVLASGRSSRLVQQLLEQRGLVEAVNSSFSLQRDASMFTITAWLEPHHLDRVEALILDSISELSNTRLSDSELRRCQRLLCNDYAFSTETPAQLAGLYGYYSTIADPKTAILYPHMIRAITAQDLQSIAQRFLSPYHYAVTVLQPL
jgi:zinc protease